jgi:hypothetical protein
MDVSNIDDDDALVEPSAATEPKPKRTRNRATRSDAGTGKTRTSRAQRRADAARDTLREILRLRKPDLDVEGLSFVEVVDRDADAWGHFVAQLAEWFSPVGQLVDLLFGAPLMTLIGLAPSVRAARRDLSSRTERKKTERVAREAEESALQPYVAGSQDAGPIP